MTDLSERLRQAETLAREAAGLALRLRPAPGSAAITLKGAQDWLTEADGAVERFLSDALRERFPEDGFQGEEAGLHRDGALRWVVDPIDGTSNFAHGGQRWCVSVGLVAGDRAVLGAIVAPELGQCFLAAEGRGATLNGRPIRAAATDALGRSIVECGWSPRVANEAYHALCQAVMGQGAMLRSGGSGTLGLADVACGALDAYVERHINLWDVAAALAVLSEAGARTSPFLRQNTAGQGAPILAAAPGVAEALAALTGMELAG
ncbi:inositol monophosphatase family protein [Teichococcus vastitatis]|uniref:Inositol monophosphatase n=1 Tax=Teichococcus vastitatis TaxID=2307076 RepID=A0ABS9WCH0_9PROT|nr:inositol monophosphatase family protein [Pseudoroseomonas vastitatis]MCI0756995.1 inositol monophosphatase [Pseudoroseomonas vastitatis]